MTRKAIVVAALILACAIPAFGREDNVYYDDEDPNTTDSFDELAAGDIESVRFTALSPCRIEKVFLRFTGEAGDFELHIWADDGGHPDVEADLADPVVVPWTGNWANVTYDPPIDIAQAGEFHIGAVKLADDPDLVTDITPDILWRSWMRKDGEWVKNELGDYLIRAQVDWYDEPTEYTFEDASDEANVNVAGRVAWCDFDGDGWDDICTIGLGILANNGDGTFTDATESAGASETVANGCVCADFDNDGYVDIFAMRNSVEDYDRILKNNGDWTFTDVTDEMIEEEDRDLWPTEGAAWGDFNNDGYVDLYLANYEIIDPDNPDDLSNCTQDKLYYNRRGEAFEDVALAAGMDEGDYPLCGRGVAWGDYDNDGDLDIYVSNYRLDANYLWENRGSEGFVDVAEEKGVRGTVERGSYGHTIGSAWADFNNDGNLDLIALNLAHPRFIDFSDISALYINQGPPDYDFVDVISESGIYYDEVHSNPSVGDYDNDGIWDLFISAVYAGRDSFLFRGLGDLAFVETTYHSGIRIDNGWGAAWGDYDLDGRIDLLAWDSEGRNLWHNTGLDTGTNHWLKVRTFGTTANYASIGTRVEVTVGDTTLTQVVSGGSGTTSQDTQTLHFGLGEATKADRVKATWLGGTSTERSDVAADQILTLVEGQEEDDAAGDDDDDDGCGCD